MSSSIELSGGKKLEAYLKDLGKKLSLKGTVRVGFLEGATYPTGIKAKALRDKYKERKRKNVQGAVKGSTGGQTVAEVAAINEFGSETQVPRPFFRSMIAKESKHWGEDMWEHLQHANFNAERALGNMGEQMVGELKQSINDFQSPPLKPSTIKAKGFEKPLIDTAHMINSVDKEVQ